MSICVAVVGAGRMGSVVAGQLPARTKKIIIDIDRGKARRLAEKVKGTPADNLESTAEADLVAVVLPTPVVNETVDVLLNVAKNGAIILNMATTAHIDPALFEKNRQVSIVDTKIIGHAMSISRGEPGIVVVNCDDARMFGLIKGQLPGFYKVVQGDAGLVEKINKILEVLAKEQGLLMIFDVSNADIVYADKNLDLTEIVLQKLNEQQ